MINLDIYYDTLSWKGLKNDHEVIWEATPEIRKKALDNALTEYDTASTKNCQ